MKQNNIALLKMLCSDNISDIVETNPILKLTSHDVCGGLIETVHEVWYSPTGHGAKDDAKSVGFIRIPYCVGIDERKVKNYRLSVLSTSITSKFHSNWKLVLDLPYVSVEHQRELFKGCYI